MSRRDAGFLMGAVTLGLVLRALFLHDIAGHPLYEALTGDPAIYLARARGILGGALTPPHAFFHSCPFYPFFLALLERLFGSGLWPVRLVQTTIGLATIPLVYELARRTVGRIPGLVAGTLAASYAPFIFFESEVLEITIVLAAVVGCLIALLAAERQGRIRQALLAGALLGLAALGKPNLLLFAPVAAVWLFVSGARREGGRRRALVIAVVFFVAAGAVILPTTVHNWRASGDLIPVSSNGGINLYIGNHPGAQGMFTVPPEMRFDLRVASKQVAERAAGRELSDGEVSDYWAGLALDFVRSHPGAFLGLTARKFVLFWNHYEIPNHYDMNFVAEFAPVLRLSPSRFAVVAPLGLLGLALAARRRLRVGLLILFGSVFALSVIPFFITARYRLAIVPVLLVGAGYALTWLWETARERRWKRLAAALVVLAAVSWGVNVRTVEFSGGAMHNTLGAILGSRGDMEGAAREFAAALESSPEDLSARYNLGLALLELGRAGEAATQLRRALEQHPGYHEAALELARAYFELGELDDAERAASRLLHADPPAPAELVRVAESAISRIEQERAGRSPTTE